MVHSDPDGRDCLFAQQVGEGRDIVAQHAVEQGELGIGLGGQVGKDVVGLLGRFGIGRRDDAGERDQLHVELGFEPQPVRHAHGARLDQRRLDCIQFGTDRRGRGGHTLFAGARAPFLNLAPHRRAAC